MSPHQRQALIADEGVRCCPDVGHPRERDALVPARAPLRGECHGEVQQGRHCTPVPRARLVFEMYYLSESRWRSNVLHDCSCIGFMATPQTFLNARIPVHGSKAKFPATRVTAHCKSATQLRSALLVEISPTRAQARLPPASAQGLARLRTLLTRNYLYLTPQKLHCPIPPAQRTLRAEPVQR